MSLALLIYSAVSLVDEVWEDCAEDIKYPEHFEHMFLSYFMISFCPRGKKKASNL